MLISISLIGFALAALTYAGLGALLVIRGAPTSTGRLFIAAIVAQIAWGATIATAMAGRPLPVALIASVEAARLFLWIAFLLSLVRSARPEDSGSSMQRSASTGLVAAATIAAGMLAIDVFAFGERPAFTVRVIAAVFALVCLEQVYRNTPPGRRWAMKFLAVALVALFGFDLVMYSEALMFSRLNPALWSARGYANALLAPLLAIAAARNRNWKLEISVSRQVVFHSTTLSAAGLYLLLMAAAGYWVRLFGGDWGAVVQALILFVAAIGAVVMLMSGTLRARLRVFLAKNFFSYRFDYRAEWLRLTQLLAEAPETGQGAAAETDPLEVRAIRGLAALVESTGGALWMRNEDGQFVCAARVRFAANTPAIPATHPMSVFLRDRQWVVSLPEWRENPERYDRLTLPDALTDHPDNWLIVPLMLHEELLGFVVLTRPLAADRSELGSARCAEGRGAAGRQLSRRAPRGRIPGAGAPVRILQPDVGLRRARPEEPGRATGAAAGECRTPSRQSGVPAGHARHDRQRAGQDGRPADAASRGNPADRSADAPAGGRGGARRDPQQARRSPVGGLHDRSGPAGCDGPRAPRPSGARDRPSDPECGRGQRA